MLNSQAIPAEQTPVSSNKLHGLHLAAGWCVRHKMAAGLQSSAKRVGVHMCEGCMSPKGPRGGPSRDNAIINGANMALGEKCGGEYGSRGGGGGAAAQDFTTGESPATSPDNLFYNSSHHHRYCIILPPPQLTPPPLQPTLPP